MMSYRASKTIAKVTAPRETYSDGSYCVPCVTHALEAA